jgi:hypothetical protein
MAGNWEKDIEKMFAQVAAQLGPHARAVLSVFGRVDQEKPPEIAEQIKQKTVDRARSSRQGKGRPGKDRAKIIRDAEKYGVEAAASMNRVSVDTVKDYLKPSRRR